MGTGQKYPYETATAEQRKIGSYWWNIHHESLIEVLTEPIRNRVKCIREGKPEKEWECRLKNMAPVLQPEVLPWAYTRAVEALGKAKKTYNEARKAYGGAWKSDDKAWRAYSKTQKAYNKAWDVLRQAEEACTGELEALHRGDYPDSTWTGKSIFKEQ